MRVFVAVAPPTPGVAGDGKTAILEAKGAYAIAEAMQQHQGEAELQEDGCRALLNLAMAGPWAKENLCEAGAREAVTGAMRANPQLGKLQQMGLAVLDSVKK